MQFIPSTWQVVKVDADGDGKRNPQDIDDASLATAVYLCSGSDNLGTRQGQESAVYRYNHSQSYVNLVLRLMEAYSSGDYTAVPSGTYGGSSFSSSGYSSAISHSYKAAKQRKVKQAKIRQQQAANGGSSSGGSTLRRRHDRWRDRRWHQHRWRDRWRDRRRHGRLPAPTRSRP